MVLKSTTNILLIGLGSVSLVFGIIGILVPVLPTTPFLLLSSFCYLRSSERLHKWLINHKIFGSYIYNYMTYRAVKKSTKIGALISLWLSLGLSIILLKNLILKILLFVTGSTVSIHLIKLKTLEKIQTDFVKKSEEG